MSSFTHSVQRNNAAVLVTTLVVIVVLLLVWRQQNLHTRTERHYKRLAAHARAAARHVRIHAAGVSDTDSAIVQDLRIDDLQLVEFRGADGAVVTVWPEDGGIDQVRSALEGGHLLAMPVPLHTSIPIGDDGPGVAQVVCYYAGVEHGGGWLDTVLLVAALAVAGSIYPLCHVFERHRRSRDRLLAELLEDVSAHTQRSASDTCEIELADLARRVKAIRREMVDWKTRARNLKSNIDDSVDRRTQQVRTALARAEKQSQMDPLTGLANRRALSTVGSELVARAAREHVELSCVVLDVDNFKQCNDSYGHRAGDMLLAELGGLIRSHCRNDDLAVRYGGDEFLLLLYNTTCAQAGDIAERIRLLVRQVTQAQQIADSGVAVSAGVAGLREHAVDNPARVDHAAGSSCTPAKVHDHERNRTTTKRLHLLDELIGLADAALYGAKCRGRNCVCVFDPAQLDHTAGS